MCDWYMARIGTAADAEVLIDRAAQNASKALSLDDTVSWAHFANSLILGYRRDFDAAIDAARHAVALQPGNAEIRAGLGGALVHGGQPVEGLRVILDALSLNPHAHGGYRLLAARAYDMLGDMDRALEESRIAALDIAFGANLNIACLLARKDRVPEARIALAEALRLNPQFTLSDIDRYLWCLDGDYVATVTDGLRKAGLPE